MDKILPCPFCGSEDIDMEADIFLVCNNCKAEGPVVNVCRYVNDPNSSLQAEVVAAWNKRDLDAAKAVIAENGLRCGFPT